MTVATLTGFKGFNSISRKDIHFVPDSRIENWIKLLVLIFSVGGIHPITSLKNMQSAVKSLYGKLQRAFPQYYNVLRPFKQALFMIYSSGIQRLS